MATNAEQTLAPQTAAPKPREKKESTASVIAAGIAGYRTKCVLSKRPSAQAGGRFPFA